MPSQTSKKLSDALTLVERGKKDQAHLILDEVARNIPEDPDECIQLGCLCMALDEITLAIESFSRAIVKKPDNAMLNVYLGGAYMQSRQWEIAEAFFNKAIEIKGEWFDPLANLGALQMHRERFERGVELLEKAEKLEPGNAKVKINMAECFIQLHRYDEAISCAKKAIQLNPRDPLAPELLGRIYIELGRGDEAGPYFQKAIKLNKTFGLAYAGLATARKFTDADADQIEKIERVVDSDMHAMERSSIFFSLGKMHDDRKMWDKAFDYYRRGNIIRKQSSTYDAPKILLKNIKTAFTRDFLQSRIRQNISEDEVTPCFVLGMPRSGTSLMEQVIASHPLADGAGELKEIGRIGSKMEVTVGRKKGGIYKSVVADNISQESLSLYASEYLEVLSQGKTDAKLIVDKMPDNFMLIGAIHLMFPQAKIIHMIRHPLDNCLSCYFQNFATMQWSFDLEWIAKRYKFYREAMDHWRSVLPPEVMLEVHYEELVDDLESKSREVLDFIGLEWDPACLAFNKTERSVKTASRWQVRQPIYKTSKLRAKNYAKYLQGLVDDLSPYLQDDKEALAEWGLNVKSSWWRR